jgi:hypothetical protein
VPEASASRGCKTFKTFFKARLGAEHCPSKRNKVQTFCSSNQVGNHHAVAFDACSLQAKILAIVVQWPMMLADLLCFFVCAHSIVNSVVI